MQYPNDESAFCKSAISTKQRIIKVSNTLCGNAMTKLGIRVRDSNTYLTVVQHLKPAQQNGNLFGNLFESTQWCDQSLFRSKMYLFKCI